MSMAIDHRGVYVDACTVTGETRADRVVPAHPNGIQLSARRWLTIYATRGFRGGDDDRSTVYQIRDGSPAGNVIREGLLAPTRNDWDPLGNGSVRVKQCGHPVAFGVPKGACIRGRPVPNANVFVVKWRTSSRILDPATNRLLHWDETPGERGYIAVEWIQFRLNRTEDDIDILQPTQPLRQNGYAGSNAFCRHEQFAAMNQSFVQPVPHNADASEWVVVEHFDQSRLVPVKFAFNTGSGLYEWTETGPVLNSADKTKLYEASTLVFKDSWLVAGRTQWGDRRLAWLRTDDLFAAAAPPPFTMADSIRTDAPHTVYNCPDNVVRVFTGDSSVSPYGQARCPLYCWDVDPDAEFAADTPKVVFDSVAAGLPFALEDHPTLDMCKLLPHTGGSVGYLVHRVRDCCHDHPGRVTANTLTENARAATAVYWAEVRYDQEYPCRWEWSPGHGKDNV